MDLDPIPNEVFVALYAAASMLLALLVVQAFRFARRRRAWGPWAVFIHFSVKTLFVADLTMLRSVWANDHNGITGANGWLTFVLRFLWVTTLAIMLQAARRQRILVPPNTIPRRRWDDWKPTEGVDRG